MKLNLMTEVMAHTSSSNSDAAPIVDFVSMGMTVLDELHIPSQNTLYDVPGGSGLYGKFTQFPESPWRLV